jgi:hypothetical protein
MPSETKVTYNGVILDQVRIIEYSIDNGATADNPTVGPYTHVIRGEALVQNVAGEGKSNDNFMLKLRGLLNQPRKPLQIWIDQSTAPGTSGIHYLANLTSADERGGPFFRANITEITGTSSLLVNFTVEWTQTVGQAGVPFSMTEANPNLVRSFYTISQFSVDQTGRTTIRKTGSLQLAFVPKLNSNGSLVSPRAKDTSGRRNDAPYGVYNVGDQWRNDIVLDFLVSGGANMDHADYYRRIVAGNLYRGFRRVRQEYAIDESRCRLIFDITDEESFRGLPAPAKVADCNYAFRRALGDDGAAMGQKMFSAEIEGDKNVSPGALLTLAIRLSQNRIDYANDLITEIKVAEVGMLTRNAISFEVMALATSIQNYTPSEESEGFSTLIPDQKALLLKNILTPVQLGTDQVFKFQEAYMPDEYGASLIVRVATGAYSPLDKENDASERSIQPTTLQLKEGNPAIYLFPDAVFDAYTEEQLNQGDGVFRYIKPLAYRVKSGPNKGDLAKASDEDRPEPTMNPKNGVKYTVHTGIVECPSVSPSGDTVIFQIGAPRVEQTRYSDGSRKNAPPENQIGDLPVNSQVSRRSVSVTSGQPDVNGNRVMTAGYDETICTRYRADLNAQGVSASDPNFKRTEATVNGETVSLLVWTPSDVPLPQDPNQGTVSGYTYPTYNEIQFGTNGAYA